MKNKIKLSYLLFGAIWLIGILADCGFIGCALTHHHQLTQIECNDNHCECGHTLCTDHEIFVSITKTNSEKESGQLNSLPITDCKFSSSYISSIWQPPRIT